MFANTEFYEVFHEFQSTMDQAELHDLEGISNAINAEPSDEHILLAILRKDKTSDKTEVSNENNLDFMHLNPEKEDSDEDDGHSRFRT